MALCPLPHFINCAVSDRGLVGNSECPDQPLRQGLCAVPYAVPRPENSAKDTLGRTLLSKTLPQSEWNGNARRGWSEKAGPIRGAGHRTEACGGDAQPADSGVPLLSVGDVTRQMSGGRSGPHGAASLAEGQKQRSGPLQTDPEGLEDDSNDRTQACFLRRPGRP